MKILFTGGGTLGPVMPLLAVKEAWTDLDPSLEAVWVGTPNGPERAVLEAAGVRFLTLPVFRFPRYPSREWIFAPVNAARAFVSAFFILAKERPDLVATAGGYTGVPLAVFAKLFGIPVWVHQQDATVLLANRLMAPFAHLITVTWPDLVSAFPNKRTECVGNPVRRETSASHVSFPLDTARPTVLVLGGGSGSVWLNTSMEKIGQTLSAEANVVHITGLGKMTPTLQTMGKTYHAAELLPGGLHALLATADLVVSRAGMGTLSEIVSSARATILIPLPDTPQEANAKHVLDTRSGVVLSQRTTSPQDLLASITSLLNDPATRKAYGERMHHLFPTDIAASLVGRLICLAKK